MGALAKDEDLPLKRRPGGTCNVAVLLEAVDADDNAVVREWINNPAEYAAAAIASKLVDHGHPMSRSSIERHRRRECTCRLDRPELYE